MSKCDSFRAPRVTLLAAALSLALSGAVHNAQATASAPHRNGNTAPTAHVPLDFTRLRAAFTKYAAQAPKSTAPQRAPATRAIMNTADSGSGSLREALASAVDGDVIDLSGVHGTIHLSSALEATASVTINGPGEHLLMLEGAGSDRVLQSAHDLHVSNVTIAGGATSPFTLPIGGCIYVAGDINLNNTTVTGCTAADKDYSYGGAIAAQGYVFLKYSTVSNSSAKADGVSGSGGGGYPGANLAAGGGVAALKGLALFSSTLSGNSAAQSNGARKQAIAEGGGAVVGYSSNLNTYVIYSTVSGNTVSAAGGSYYNPVTMTTTPVYGITLGGGVSTLGGAITAVSTISGNTATGNGRVYGGGEFFGKYSQVFGSAVSNNSVSSSTYSSTGGGISAANALVVAQSAFSGNEVTSVCPASCFISGGALYSKGQSLAVQASTFSGNSLTATGSVYAAGGAIGVGYGAYATATLTNSTITGNTVAIDPSKGGNGAGVWVGGPLTVNNSTVAFNTASSNGGGITVDSAASNTLYSSIVANNTASGDSTTNDLLAFNPVTIAGGNDLVMAAGSNITLPGATLNGDPLLQPLAFNGGPTKTHALGAGSPAIDTGAAPVSLTTDQRGYTRVVGAAADIGAFELDTDRIFTDGFNFPLLQ